MNIKIKRTLATAILIGMILGTSACSQQQSTDNTKDNSSVSQLAPVYKNKCGQVLSKFTEGTYTETLSSADSMYNFKRVVAENGVAFLQAKEGTDDTDDNSASTETDALSMSMDIEVIIKDGRTYIVNPTNKEYFDFEMYKSYIDAKASKVEEDAKASKEATSIDISDIDTSVTDISETEITDVDTVETGMQQFFITIFDMYAAYAKVDIASVLAELSNDFKLVDTDENGVETYKANSGIQYMVLNALMKGVSEDTKELMLAYANTDDNGDTDDISNEPIKVIFTYMENGVKVDIWGTEMTFKFSTPTEEELSVFDLSELKDKTGVSEVS